MPQLPKLSSVPVANTRTIQAEMNQVVVAIEQISCTTEEIAAKVEDINLHTGKTKTLRLSLDEHTQGLSRQVEALNHSAGQFRIV